MDSNRNHLTTEAGGYTGDLSAEAGILFSTERNADGHRYEVAHLGAQHATAGELPGVSAYAVALELARRWNAAPALDIELRAEREHAENLKRALKHLVTTIEDLGAVNGRATVSVKGAAMRQARNALAGIIVGGAK